VQANELHQTKPLVSVIMDHQGALLSREKIYQMDLSRETSVQITRAIEPANLPKFDIMLGF
jgi:hypothetical protein